VRWESEVAVAHNLQTINCSVALPDYADEGVIPLSR